MKRGILLSAVLSVTLAAGLIVAAVAAARPTMRSAVLRTLLGPDAVDRCVASPADWGWRAERMSVFAYDDDGHSAAPSAPPLEPPLLERARRTGQVVHREGASVVSVLPTGRPGPCAFLRVTSLDILAVAGPRLGWVLAVAILIGMLLAALLTLGLVVRPLQRRIDALATAAAAVGGDAYRPEPLWPDALGQIGAVLTESHLRVVETRDALEARHRELEDHLSGIAHDLRTPLASMQLALEGLATDAEGPLRQEARRALADVVYLAALVENLHQGTRLRQDVEVAAGDVELGGLVDRLERRFAIVGRHGRIEVAASVPEEQVWVACAPALAERAIANLVQNAVEHHPGSGHVAITLAVEEGTFELVVADDGPGLREAIPASLDAATFVQEAARRRGPGLGMLITAEVARRAGWTLVYEALEPHGLAVQLRGPVRAR